MLPLLAHAAEAGSSFPLDVAAIAAPILRNLTEFHSDSAIHVLTSIASCSCAALVLRRTDGDADSQGCQLTVGAVEGLILLQQWSLDDGTSLQESTLPRPW